MPDNSSRSALAELVLVRVREFVREPEAVFWTFVFPLLLAAGLGIAFRNRPPETVRVGVVSSPVSERAVATLRESKELIVESYADDSSAARAANGECRARRRAERTRCDRVPL